MLIESSKEMMTWALRDKQEFLEQKGRKRSKRKLDMRQNGLDRADRKTKMRGLRVQAGMGKQPSRAGIWARKVGGSREEVVGGKEMVMWHRL